MLINIQEWPFLLVWYSPSAVKASECLNWSTVLCELRTLQIGWEVVLVLLSPKGRISSPSCGVPTCKCGIVQFSIPRSAAPRTLLSYQPSCSLLQDLGSKGLVCSRLKWLCLHYLCALHFLICILCYDLRARRVTRSPHSSAEGGTGQLYHDMVAGGRLVQG